MPIELGLGQRVTNSGNTKRTTLKLQKSRNNMNWIEIDKWLVTLMQASNDDEQLYKDAMKKFSWSRSQAEAAIQPLQKRYTFERNAVETPKKRSKPSTKRK